MPRVSMHDATMNTTVIHVIPSFHYDVAYTKTFEDYLPRSFRCIEEGLRLLEKCPDFTFGVEQVILARELWNRKLRCRGAMKQFAAEGRLFFAPGMFTMPDANIPSGESFIRNALLGRKWLQEHLGVTPTCCWMADIFGHAATMPGLAATCGFTSYLFERGKAGSWSTTFRWKGLDGTAIDTQWEIDTYFGLRTALTWMDVRPRDWIDARIIQEVVEPLRRHSPCPDILMTPLGGDFRVPKEDEIRFIHDWNNRRRDVRFVFSTPERYFKALKNRGVRLRTESTDLNPLFEGCYSSRIRIKQAGRSLEETATAVEAFETVIGAGHTTADALWEVSAWNAFHDIICGTIKNDAVKECLSQYRKALRKGERALTRMGRRLADGRGSGTVYLNSLPYARREIVDGPDGPCAVAAPPLGIGVPSTPHRIAGRVRISKAGRVIENAKVRVTLGRNGTIAEIRDKTTGRVLSGGARGLGNPLREGDYGDSWVVKEGPLNPSLLRAAARPDFVPLSGGGTIQRDDRISRHAVDADCFAWPEPEVTLDHPLMGTVAVSYPEIGLRQELSLCNDERLIRFRTTFLPSGRRYRLRMGFFSDIRNGRARHAIPGGYIEGRTGEYPAQSWVDFADRTRGLLVVNRGLPGNSIVDGVVMLSLFRGVAFDKPGETLWYEEGIEQVFEYGIMLFDPRDKAYDPARMAARFNRPLIPIEGVVPEKKAGTPFVTLDGRAEMTCLRRDGHDVIIRLWETAGVRSPILLTFADAVERVTQTDAVGTPRKTLRAKSHELGLTLGPFEIATLKVTGRGR